LRAWWSARREHEAAVPSIADHNDRVGVSRAFLTAEWRQLIMLNYEVDPRLLHDLVPHGTEIDSWSGRTFVSLVGFLFDRTRVLGLPVPFHQTFEEVNLRFYVRRVTHGEVRRAVTFIKELVPRALIARVARLAYNEPYSAVTMQHHYGPERDDGVPEVVEYSWRVGPSWTRMRVTPSGEGRIAAADSEEAFITEHYWGYTRQRDGSTVEYRVTHPRWRVWAVEDVVLTGSLSDVYGPAFGAVVAAPPSSAFLADGSGVAVGWPTRLKRGE
jgi:uncharacterized protein YqjF (DUF2071 family)